MFHISPIKQRGKQMERTKAYWMAKGNSEAKSEWLANPSRVGKYWDHLRNRPMTEAEVARNERNAAERRDDPLG